MSSPPVARPSPSQADYMIGWVCIIPEEYYAALAILDEQYDSSHIVPGQGDRSSYILGRMGKHPVVINVPAATHYGELHASTIAKNMKSTFARIRFVLLVGIGGGIPVAQDIRLGDVVLGTRVVPYAFGKETDYGFVRTGQIFTPPQTLLTAITGLQGLRRLRATDISRCIDSIGDRHGSGKNDYARPGEDRLYDGEYTHDGRYCDCLKPKAELNSRMLPRGARRSDLVQIHQGNIGTASVVMKNAKVRDMLATQENLICFKMEATGVMLNVPCLPIRGISDYADGHKNDVWQPYAALAAAVCAKELLATMSPRDVLYSPLELDGPELENYVKGAIANPSRHGDDLHFVQLKMEALMDRHKLVEDRLAPELEKLKDTSRADLKDVRDKVKDLEGLLVKIKGSLQDLTEQIEEHLNFHQEKDFVTREEWKELKMQVDRNTSKVEDLSIVANGALATTQALLGDLGGRLGNQELIWYSKWVAYANQYTGHITSLARGWRKEDNGNVTETQTSPHCKGPHKPGEMIQLAADSKSTKKSRWDVFSRSKRAPEPSDQSTSWPRPYHSRRFHSFSETPHQPKHTPTPANRNLQQISGHDTEEDDPSLKSLNEKISKFGGGGGSFRPPSRPFKER
ncbi:Pf [Aspergillus parasiticus SU-1]|uniref:Pf n=1 Tax=Aspergillus parasiticus (strain ATCC 56775 / NRRL 5862 / SRRC 143 / SU-1) TaxID=1403190 RepID=A0A0F0IEG9_ASPPU|nr:Pf [Aspergillus parasiticus SU-1]